MRVLAVGLALALGATVPGLWVVMPEEPAPGVDALAPAEVGVRQFSWSSAADAADVAFEVTIELLRVSDCELSFQAAGKTSAAGGPEFVKVVRAGGGQAVTMMTEDGAAQVHVNGALDSRGTVLQSDGVRWSVDSKHRRPESVGELSLFFAARHVAPWTTNPATGPDSLRFEFSCEGPFRITAQRVAEQAVLVNERSLVDGQRVHVGGVATLANDQQIQARLSGPYAKMMVGQYGNAGTLAFTTPQGLREVDLAAAERFYVFEQGPGAYGIGLDCLCRGSFWAAFADLREDAGLSRLATD